MDKSVPVVNYSTIARLTATRCCVCRAHLTDAESVEHGIGPICSRRYYNPLHQPTETQVKETLGHLAFSGLPDHVVDGFLTLVDNNHQNARKACNLLIYWASCHQHDREEVFKCAGIIRALGYFELAAKLETDRTDAAVIEEGPDITVWIPDRRTIIRDVARIPGAVTLLKKNGHKVGFRIPATRKGWINAVLGVHLGGKLACGPQGTWKILRRLWSDVLRFQDAESAASQTVPVQTGTVPETIPSDPEISIVRVGPCLEVRTPYSEPFKTDLKSSIPCKFRDWKGFWAIDPIYEETVKRLIEHHFGTGDSCP